MKHDLKLISEPIGNVLVENPLCYCSLEIEDTLYYLLHCQYFNHIRIELMNSVKYVYDNFESLSDKDKKIYYMVTHA